MTNDELIAAARSAVESRIRFCTPMCPDGKHDHPAPIIQLLADALAEADRAKADAWDEGYADAASGDPENWPFPNPYREKK